jgi:UDPglucose 6-dehydrogenase
MQKTINSNLRFTTDIAEALENASVVFLALPTPTKNFGYQQGKAYDLSYTEVGIRSIVNFYNKNEMKNDVIVVEKSTVPIGTFEMLTNLINANSIEANKNRYTVASNPEFLAEGTAVDDLIKPDRVILGSKKGSNIQKLSKLFSYVG